jgi:hypothetical protein
MAISWMKQNQMFASDAILAAKHVKTRIRVFHANQNIFLVPVEAVQNNAMGDFSLP